MNGLRVLIFFGCVSMVTALQCYACSDSNCNDKYDKPTGHRMECPADYGGCAKLRLETEVFGIEFTKTIRQCGENFLNTQCGDPLTEEAHGIEVVSWACSCSGTLCNSAVSSLLVSTELKLGYLLIVAGMTRLLMK